MNILYIVSNRMGRGTYWRALGYAQALAKRNHQLTLLAVGSHKRGVKKHQLDSVTVIETPDLMPTSGYDPWDTLNRIAWLRDKKFDLIHLFENRPVTIFPGLLNSNKHGTPLFMDWCDWFGKGGSVEERPSYLLRTILRPIETFFEQNFRSRAIGTTVINTILQKKAEALGIANGSILYLPNIANLGHMRVQNKEAVRQKLNLPLNSPILGYTGAIFEKDARLMAQAFDALLKQKPTAKLLLIGYNNQPIEEWVRDKTAVIRTGFVSSEALAEYVSACDVGWLTLVNNGANQGRFPMKTFDFMAAGRPLLVTDLGDLRPFVEGSNIGVVAQDAPEEIAKVTIQLLADPLRQQKLGENGRDVVTSQFNENVLAEKLEAFYFSKLST
ncbi:MAG: glycosyltransferase [Chloroflexota bacterium]